MASVKIASHNYFAFENSLSNPVRTDSFSSYLNFIRENFRPELENSAPERMSCQISLNRKKAASREIDVFDAKKYFSEKLDDDRLEATKFSPNKPASREARSRAHKPRSAAGSTCSDTSSNMSQRTLLREHGARLSRRKGADASSRSRFLGVFPCPYAGKNAVSVVREAHTRGSPMEHRRDWRHASRGADGRTMRDPRMHGVRDELKDHIYATLPPSWNNAVKPIEMELIDEEKVGLPNPVLQKGDLLISSAKANMIGREEEEEEEDSRGGRSEGNEDEDEDVDVVSETSSDLFEIETISVNSQPFFSRQGTESTTGYEPSEASIEWSVAMTTAITDFQPASEFSGRGLSTHGASRASRLQRPGLLMACASNKAVEVGSSSYKKPERASFDVESQFFPEGSAAAVARFRAESCGVMNVDASCNTARVVAPAAFVSGRSIGSRARLHYGDA